MGNWPDLYGSFQVLVLYYVPVPHRDIIHMIMQGNTYSSVAELDRYRTFTL